MSFLFEFLNLLWPLTRKGELNRARQVKVWRWQDLMIKWRVEFLIPAYMGSWLDLDLQSNKITSWLLCPEKGSSLPMYYSNLPTDHCTIEKNTPVPASSFTVLYLNFPQIKRKLEATEIWFYSRMMRILWTEYMSKGEVLMIMEIRRTLRIRKWEMKFLREWERLTWRIWHTQCILRIRETEEGSRPWTWWVNGWQNGKEEA